MFVDKELVNSYLMCSTKEVKTAGFFMQELVRMRII